MPLFGPPDVGQLKANRDVKGLIKALGYNADAGVRRAAAAALGELGDPRAAEALVSALKSNEWQSDWHDTSAATDALVRLGAAAVGPLVEVLAWHSKVVRVSAAGALAAIGRPAIEPLIGLLGDSDLETRETAGQILAEIGPDAGDALVAALRDPAPGRRQRAARALGEIGDPRAVAALCGALGDPISGVRQTAARSLGEIADPRAADPLANALRDADPAVHKAAALSLAEIRDPRAVEPLLPEVWGPKPQPAIDALVKVGEPAVGPMIARLVDLRARGEEAWIVDEMRKGAAVVLGRLGYPEELAGLVARLFSQDALERTAAVRELERLDATSRLDERGRALITALKPSIELSGDDAASGDDTASDIAS